MSQPFSRDRLCQIFQKLDKDGSGTLSASELQKALSNGTWTPFNIMTVQAMIDLFSPNHSLEVNFDGFLRLWDFVEGWQRYFKAVDRDNSGCIDIHELQSAISQAGYRLSPAMYQLMMCRFDRQKKGVVYFDDFMHMCIILQKLTEQFRNLDTDRDGYIQIGFEDFLVRVFTVFT
ncbi:Programmed cell death protein 6 [Echinococcus granulosus]|uniref:Programmed cell death protein 6 n=1 Tax=Echinococcus granulosus TaxID=6210 RepID=U6JJF9_ECHGR|nr:Programmed cell death protein 6 [Echinococcus granulosus]EUB60619.1 Programmed cell death protein 6 [Echinococcus granulosus]KAH9283525.1 Programmed cell death protein 6 [Echinococcus granulosus]CDS23470.1 programmed cell death protein 6 [Echinococcus granulosus]